MATDPLAPARKDFRVFLGLVWDRLGLPEPDPIQLDIAFYLQYGASQVTHPAGVPARVCYTILRGAFYASSISRSASVMSSSSSSHGGESSSTRDGAAPLAFDANVVPSLCSQSTISKSK